MPYEVVLDGLSCFIGKTVTIFTTSGGISGSGFTGVLVEITPNFVKLITDIGAPPSCPLGSCCSGPVGNCGPGFSNPCNWLGSVCVIPLCSIASFTHHAI